MCEAEHRPRVGVGVDPGSHKCGLAALDEHGQRLLTVVVPVERLADTLRDWASRWELVWVVVGNGTQSRPALAASAGVVGAERVVARDEYGTTLLARARWWREHPPRGLWRLIPTSLRVPPEPFDDLVATILAERYREELAGCNQRVTTASEK